MILMELILTHQKQVAPIKRVNFLKNIDYRLKFIYHTFMIKSILMTVFLIFCLNIAYAQQHRIAYRSQIVYGYGLSLDSAIRDASRYGIAKNSPTTFRNLDRTKPVIVVPREIITAEIVPNLHQQLLYQNCIFKR